MKFLEPKTDKIKRMPVICMRSFFSQSISRRLLKHRAWTMAAITLFFAVSLAVVLINSQAGFAVYFNGEQVGNTRSMEDVSAIVTDAESQLKEILGRDYSLDQAISVEAGLGVRTDDTENIKNAIIGGVDGVAELYVLEVNGKTVGASADENVLDAILNSILEEYSTDNTSSIRFADTVTVSYGFVSEDILQEPESIKALLEPGNTSSPYSLTIENTEQTQFYEDVAYNVESYDDGTLYEGDTLVKTAGVPGVSLVTENTVYINGIQESKQVISEVTVTAPVNEVVAIGTAERPLTASYGSYIWPAEGVISSGFGYRTGFGSDNHQGLDIAGSYGEDIVAADGGEVILAESYSGYGLMIQIRHDNGDITYYGHCSKLLVKAGERVYQGQVIAQMGATGVANGVHCHFELRVNNEPVDPTDYLH